jgi:hypothetical protein
MSINLTRAAEIYKKLRALNLPVEAAIVQYFAEHPLVPKTYTKNEVRALADVFEVDIERLDWINLATGEFQAKRAADIAELDDFKLTPGQKKDKAIAEGANDSLDALEKNRARLRNSMRIGAFESKPHAGSGAAGKPPEAPSPAQAPFAAFKGSAALKHRGKPWEHAPSYLQDHCETLGVPWPTTREAAQKLYRAKAMAVHPDRNGGNDEKFKVVQAAWERLDDFFQKANS